MPTLLLNFILIYWQPFSDCDAFSCLETKCETNGFFYKGGMVKRNDRTTVSRLIMKSFRRLFKNELIYLDVHVIIDMDNVIIVLFLLLDVTSTVNCKINLNICDPF